MNNGGRTPIDNLIPVAVQTVALQVEKGVQPYFWKDDVVKEILSHRQLVSVITDLQKRYMAWKFDQIVLRDINMGVGHYLSNTRDRFGIRQYECYAAGERRKRWMPIRAVTIAQLRSILQEARVLERDVHLRGEGYHLALERLERLNRENVVLGDVYEEVAPLILEYKKASRVAIEADGM